MKTSSGRCLGVGLGVEGGVGVEVKVGVEVRVLCPRNLKDETGRYCVDYPYNTDEVWGVFFPFRATLGKILFLLLTLFSPQHSDHSTPASASGALKIKMKIIPDMSSELVVQTRGNHPNACRQS